MCWCVTWSHAQAPPPAEPPIPIPIAQDGTATKFMDAIEAHMDYVTENSYDQLGTRTTPMWLSTIDLRSNGLPNPLIPNAPRWNGTLLSAPGANLYWDQPTLLAAFELSKRTGCKCYSDAASAYITSFVTACSTQKQTSCIDARVYYNVKLEQSVDNTATLTACVPYTPAWDTTWAADKTLARQQIHAFIRSKTVQKFTGDSENHSQSVATGAPSLSMENETALIASLCWLARQDTRQQESLIQQAISLARLRISRCNRRTGLVPTSPKLHDEANDTSSIAIGAWAKTLFWAAAVTGEMEFQIIAEKSLRAWLTVGFDARTQLYYQQVACKTGLPVEELAPANRVAELAASSFQHISIFEYTNRPAHQSPLRMAEACLSLHAKTGDQLSKEAVERWVNIIKQQLPADNMGGGYADDYGRAIHFLVRASEVLKNPGYRMLALDIANQAMEQLYVSKMGMFRSHPVENRCDSADGPGLLLLALMYLEGNDPTTDSSLQF
ncbi:MAG: hypothetical protein CMM07_22475 [Rhodopirellula sp.]|nr:hypothetical protein [Rhodopirellula sp.]